MTPIWYAFHVVLSAIFTAVFYGVGYFNIPMAVGAFLALTVGPIWRPLWSHAKTMSAFGWYSGPLLNDVSPQGKLRGRTDAQAGIIVTDAEAHEAHSAGELSDEGLVGILMTNDRLRHRH
jgi:hypothetical protein